MKTLNTIYKDNDLNTVDKLNSILPDMIVNSINRESGIKNKTIYFSELDMTGLEGMFKYSKQKKFFEFLEGRNPHKNITDTKNYINLLLNRIEIGYKNGLAMYWFIRLTKTNEVIGSMGLTGIKIKEKEAEIGYGLSPDYWGSGIIFEMLYNIINYSFEVLDLKKLIAVAESENKKSIDVLKYSGFEAAKSLANQQKEITLTLDNNKNNNKILIISKILNQNWDL